LQSGGEIVGSSERAFCGITEEERLRGGQGKSAAWEETKISVAIGK